jgi:uncharacterized protein
MNTLFPIFVKFSQFNVLIVGGGNVGLEKLTAVLGNSPDTPITLVGTMIRPDVREFAKDFPQVRLIERPFEPSDLDGKQFAITATDNPAVNEEVRNLAKARSILVNVADTPHLCDFYLSSIVRKGDLKIAISTNGKSPTVAKRLKEVFTEVLPDELETLLQRMPAIRQQVGGDFANKVRRLDALTASLVDDSGSTSALSLPGVFPQQNLERIGDGKWRRVAMIASSAFGLLLIANILSVYWPFQDWIGLFRSIDTQFWIFAGVGFIAQLVDGLLGMGYGVVTQIALMSTGIPLAAVSSSIHTAEVFSAGASGLSHYRFGNINRRLFRALVLPGIAGAVIGAAMLAWLGSQYSGYLKPLLACYTLFLGLRILGRTIREQIRREKVRRIGWLAALGGFLDSFGGGGWGPLVTSTLLSKGKTPQYVIGSVSLTEFFVTLASALTFFALIGIDHWPVIAGLILGGVLAAPLAARLAGKLPLRTMFVLVGSMIVFWSVWVLFKRFLL